MQFASVTPGDEVAWLSSGLGNTGKTRERKIVFINIIIISSYEYVSFLIQATESRDLFRCLDNGDGDTSPVNLHRGHNDTSCQKTEAKQLFYELCVFVFVCVDL